MKVIEDRLTVILSYQELVAILEEKTGKSFKEYCLQVVDDDGEEIRFELEYED